MLVLVTGSSGRVGKRVCTHLVDRGFDVRGVDVAI
jgi:nucleoside-diphosphate-sugar epimerase